MAKVSLRAYNHEIEAMIDRGHLDEAVAHCRHILKSFPKHLDTYRLLGKAYLEYKRFPEAADIFTRVLASVPNDFVANVGLSIIRDEANEVDDAIWHMERAFETQPSNAAIQGELQRLYGRREGVQPPRIRMTRGALAHMYVQGELYPQAISEIKSVLKEDPGRTDMQVLLARAYYRSGLKNDAADVAAQVLRNNPYNLDANRVLMEILSVEKPESAQAYRQRVVELDPYAAQVTSSVFLSNEVPDAAITLEHLDWNGQPVGMAPDWEANQAISLEPTSPDEQPDWLKNAFGGAVSPSAPFDQAPDRPIPAFDMGSTPSQPAEPAEDIPDFLRAAGWGQSTGAFDESKPVFNADEPASPGQSIEQGDLPDWVKALAPHESAPAPQQEEELPDWINKIGTSALPVPSESAEQPDWMQGLDQPTGQAQPAEEQPDWLQGIGESEPAAAPAADEPDWLKGFGAEETQPAAAADASEDVDWLSQLGRAPVAQDQSTEASASDFDFLSQPQDQAAAPVSEDFDLFVDRGRQPETAPAADADDFDFLNPLGSQSTQVPAAEDFDFLDELALESDQLAPAAASASLGASAEEQDDAFAWLESLAAKQGATEGLLTKPEERRDEEPDWVKQARDATVEPPTQPRHAPQPAASVEELGKSEAEQDDSFAWLESLAAKQGATEGLLTKPEERLEEEPEWVRQAKATASQPVESQPEQAREEQPAIAEPAASVEELGKSEQERDDSFAWLESLAAKQGATEGLLTQPEERPAEEPDWVKQARDIGEEPAPEAEHPRAWDETRVWLRSLDEKQQAEPGELPDWLAQEQQSPAEEVAAAAPSGELTTPQEAEELPAWMTQDEGPRPEEAGPVSEPSARLDETEIWLRKLEGEELPTPQEEAQAPEWLPQAQNVPQDELAAAAPIEEPATAADDTQTWLRSLEDEAATPIYESSSDDTAVWIKSLDARPEEQPQPVEPAPAEELPAWMRDIQPERPSAEETPAVSQEAAADAEWLGEIPQPPAAQEPPRRETGPLPAWLRELDEEEPAQRFSADADLPAWLRDETGEVLAEPTRIEPTRAADWQPIHAEVESREPETVAQEPVMQEPAPEPAAEEEPVAPEPVRAAAETPVTPAPREPIDVVSIIEERVVAAEQKEESPVPAARPRKDVVRKVTGMLGDPVLSTARSELSRDNISSALENYSRLVKKGRFLEDIIYDLREASYRYPVDVDIWQSLGDAYMRANRLQDALDAYTKAEELLR